MCLGAQKNRLIEAVLFEYPQHMFWLRNKKNNFLLRTLIWGHDLAQLGKFDMWLYAYAIIEKNLMSLPIYASSMVALCKCQ